MWWRCEPAVTCPYYLKAHACKRRCGTRPINAPPGRANILLCECTSRRKQEHSYSGEWGWESSFNLCSSSSSSSSAVDDAVMPSSFGAQTAAAPVLVNNPCPEASADGHVSKFNYLISNIATQLGIFFPLNLGCQSWMCLVVLRLLLILKLQEHQCYFFMVSFEDHPAHRQLILINNPLLFLPNIRSETQTWLSIASHPRWPMWWKVLPVTASLCTNLPSYTWKIFLYVSYWSVITDRMSIKLHICKRNPLSQQSISGTCSACKLTANWASQREGSDDDH